MQPYEEDKRCAVARRAASNEPEPILVTLPREQVPMLQKNKDFEGVRGLLRKGPLNHHFIMCRHNVHDIATKIS